MTSLHSHKENTTVKSIKELHIEATTRCQLACPACPRTYAKDKLKISDIDIDVVVKSAREFNLVYFCGDHGDAIYHPNFIEIVRQLKKNYSNIKIYLDTNGSGRKIEWWSELSKLLDQHDKINFNIDGVESNNHLYRKNSRWPSILDALTTVKNNSKCQVFWRYIVFKHNEDTVFEAYKLSKELKLDSFTVIESNRYDTFEFLRPTKSLNDIVRELDDRSEM